MIAQRGAVIKEAKLDAVYTIEGFAAGKAASTPTYKSIVACSPPDGATWTASFKTARTTSSSELIWRMRLGTHSKTPPVGVGLALSKLVNVEAYSTCTGL